MLLFIFGFSLYCMTFLSLSLQNSPWSLFVCKSESNCKEMSALCLSSCFVLFFSLPPDEPCGFRDPFCVLVPEPEMDLLTSVFSLCCNVCYQKQQGKPLFLQLRVSLETKGAYFLVCKCWAAKSAQFLHRVIPMWRPLSDLSILKTVLFGCLRRTA